MKHLNNDQQEAVKQLGEVISHFDAALRRVNNEGIDYHFELMKAMAMKVVMEKQGTLPADLNETEIEFAKCFSEGYQRGNTRICAPDLPDHELVPDANQQNIRLPKF